MPRLPFRIAMFLSSYAPLFAILAFTNRSCPAAWITLTVVAALSAGLLFIVLTVLRQQTGPVIRVATSRPADGEVLAYVASYLVPFLGVNLGEVDDLVPFLAFMLILGLVYANSNMILVNPLLTIAGYHSLEITDHDGHTYKLIGKRQTLEPDSRLRPAQISRYLRIEVSRERSGDP